MNQATRKRNTDELLEKDLLEDLPSNTKFAPTLKRLVEMETSQAPRPEEQLVNWKSVMITNCLQFKRALSTPVTRTSGYPTAVTMDASSARYRL